MLSLHVIAGVSELGFKHKKHKMNLHIWCLHYIPPLTCSSHTFISVKRPKTGTINSGHLEQSPIQHTQLHALILPGMSKVRTDTLEQIFRGSKQKRID